MKLLPPTRLQYSYTVLCRQNEMKATRCTQGCHDNKSKARSMKKIPVFSNYEKDPNDFQ